MKKIILGLSASIAAFPSLASAASLASCSDFAGHGLSSIIGCFAGLVSYATYIVMTLGVLYVIWGAFNMMRGEEKREEGKKTVMYGIIGLFVMISVWGLVNILDKTFGGLSDAQAHKTPELPVLRQ